MAMARAVQGSNSIEGYHASLDDVAAMVDGEPAMDASEETQAAIGGYRQAMTYVLQAANDPTLRVDAGLLKALHFMMLGHDLSRRPGQWRAGSIWVRREPNGEFVYEGPETERVAPLIAELLDSLDGEAPTLVRAAMAHLNLVMIHPFSDGNGRMSRCLQTLVLARDGILAPVFSSIEEYLGRNTQAYYDVLADVGQGGWNPQGDARPWVRFCLVAHFRQATTHLRRIEDLGALWSKCADAAAQAKLPERVVGGMVEAALGMRLRNASYRAIVEVTVAETISELTASRDFKALADRGLLLPVGEKRGRYYLGAAGLKSIWGEIRARRASSRVPDPFVQPDVSTQLDLPWTGSP
jgi:Fic family protein